LKENGTVESHVHAHAQLNENKAFQHTVKAENKEDLAYDNGQEQKESKDDVKHSKAMLEKAKKKTIEDFLNLIEDLDQLEKDLVIESSNKTIGSCEFNADHLNVFASCIEDNLSFGVVSSKAKVCSTKHNEEEDVKPEDTVLEEADREVYLLENLLVKSQSNRELEPRVNQLCFNSFDEEMKYLEECIGKDVVVNDSVSLDRLRGVLPSSEKSKDKLLQQKGFVKSLINEGNSLIGEETIMSYEREFALDQDKEELACLNGQKKNDGQTSRVVTGVKNRQFSNED